MQFLKSFIIISLIYLFTIVICYEKSIPQKSKLLNPIEKIFHRKRRFIVFPNYSAVKLTIALSKTLIVKYPKGVGLTIEVSTYYPLQTMLEEWYPKKFRSSTTLKPSITTENIKSNVKYYYPDNSIKWSQFNNEGEIIFIPDDNQWYDFNNFSLPINKDKIWNKQNHNYYPTQNWKSYNNNRKNWTPKYSYKNNTKWNNSWNQNYRNPSKYNRWNQTSHHYKNHNPYNNQRFIPHTHLNTENDNTFKYWKHLKGHRDRRELFEHFEDLGNKFQFDVKSCIMRSICESKYNLLPPGYSLVQDLIRVLFSFPTIDGQIDDYSKAMMSETNNCDKIYRKSCSISFLKLFLNAG